MQPEDSFLDEFAKEAEMDDQSELAVVSRLKNIMSGSVGDKRKGKGKILTDFVNAVLAKAAAQLEEQETCPRHRNEYLVAVDSETRFGCERCVFED